MHDATAEARAIIDAFHNNVAETERQQRELETQESDQHFHDMYSPCNPSSTFHDLQCGHRIQTEYTASCGVTCARPKQGKPFACPACLIDVVRAEVALDSLTLGSSDDAAMDDTGLVQEDRIQYFADKYVAAMLKKGYRGCKAVQKIDEPRMQFFDQFMRQDGFGGVEDAPSDGVTARPRKRPGAGGGHRQPAKLDAVYRKKPGTWDYRDPTRSQPVLGKAAREDPGDYNNEDTEGGKEMTNDAVEVAHSGQSADACVDLVPQSEAAEAVLKAMEAFARLSTW
ncbi:hypothetical protein BKA58DRAFT_143642 [Alternaria rosae]|uniref:uncharacterized protein n=1 Tax=Alternaria rosae TaxID=1187941 RepID=UPI001E8DFF01|nr:uncharacterized protein BKA58DRAFT_143642 [Alternaria rosae]KAH6872335.1 hypothetical protein BKA58DRAFT_143642 [Alternaria rosae]